MTSSIDNDSPTSSLYNEKSPTNQYPSLDSLLNPKEPRLFDQRQLSDDEDKVISDGNGSSAVPHKYHKSCDYCRHRKIKCVKRQESKSCDHCIACDVECTFSHKLPSKKRKLKSAKIVASLRIKERVSVSGGSSVDKKESDGGGSISHISVGSVSRSPPGIKHSPSAVATSQARQQNQSQNQSTGLTPITAGGWYYEPFFDLVHSSKGSPGTPMGEGNNLKNIMSPFTNENQYHTDTGIKYDGSVINHFSTSPNSMPEVTATDYSNNSPTMENNNNLISLATLASINSPLSPNYSKRSPETPHAVKEAYTLYIEPFTPFFPTEFYHINELSNLARCCMSLASFSSPNSVAPVGSIAMLYEVVDQLLTQETVWNEFSFSAIFCVLVRYKLPFDRVSNAIQKFVEVNPSPITTTNYNLLIGAISAFAWNSFVAYDDLTPPIDNESDVLNIYKELIKDISEEKFSFHFLYVSTLLYRLKLLMINAHPPNLSTDSPSQHDDAWYTKRKKLIQLESELLLWPVRLPKHLTVVKDDLIATPAAIILHVLHNTVLLAYYTQAIKHKETYGRMLSILPVPGLLQFLCGMAASSFKCRPDIIEKWPIIKDCLVLTAELILDLYNRTEYENCKVALAIFQDSRTNPRLYSSIQKVLGSVNWAAGDEDGAALYWIFRDVRSMSLQHRL